MPIVKHGTLILVHTIVYAAFAGALPTALGPAAVLLATLLIWMSCVDLATFEIPDLASALFFVSGLVFAGLGHALIFAILGGILWFGVFWLMARLARRFLGKDSLGFGDVKLMAGIGAWLGPVLPIYVVLFASVTAICVISIFQMRQGREFSGTFVAFGPFLCLSTWVIWLSEARI